MTTQIEGSISQWCKIVEDRATNSANPINPQWVYWELGAILPEPDLDLPGAVNDAACDSLPDVLELFSVSSEEVQPGSKNVKRTVSASSIFTRMHLPKKREC